MELVGRCQITIPKKEIGLVIRLLRAALRDEVEILYPAAGMDREIHGIETGSILFQFVQLHGIVSCKPLGHGPLTECLSRFHD